jgi:hypothetical protein
MGSGRKIGSLIGAAFGLVYVEANAGSLPGGVVTALRIAAALAFLGLIALLARGSRARSDEPKRPGGQFGTVYWLVVAAEVFAIFVGAAIVRGPLGLEDAVVAWVSVVVGAHFVALAEVWGGMRFFRGLGLALGLCGVAGIAADAAGASTAVVATFGGVLPGVLLLGAAYVGALGLVADA